MRDRAEANVRAARLADRVSVEDADIRSLPYPDDTFDVVVAEAVTMFVSCRRAAAEFARVTRPGGRVLATEFYCANHPPARPARCSSATSAPGCGSTRSRSGPGSTAAQVLSTSAPSPGRSR
ncbi:MAG: class I SAM-dependent methyltransferase [Nocardioidaceae bacterium]|nr:class I SAM-dependent methyltransferase [Nocardioidaceae bacterium]